MNRRKFILGVGSGLVLPSFFDKVYSFVANHGEPLLIPPREITQDLFAVAEWADSGWQLNLGDIDSEPPPMTIREFCQRFGYASPRDYTGYGYIWPSDDCVIDLDDEMNSGAVLDEWIEVESPNVVAYRYLESLDLGPQLTGAESVGEVKFLTTGTIPGAAGFVRAEVRDEISLSLLQNRLNELNTGMQIVVV